MRIAPGKRGGDGDAAAPAWQARVQDRFLYTAAPAPTRPAADTGDRTDALRLPTGGSSSTANSPAMRAERFLQRWRGSGSACRLVMERRTRSTCGRWALHLQQVLSGACWELSFSDGRGRCPSLDSCSSGPVPGRRACWRRCAVALQAPRTVRPAGGMSHWPGQRCTVAEAFNEADFVGSPARADGRKGRGTRAKWRPPRGRQSTGAAF